MSDDIFQRKTIVPNATQHQGSTFAPRVGRRVGRYQLVEIAGRGGMGEVWKADDPHRHRPVIVKFLPSFLRGNQQEIDRLRTTFQRVEALHHQHICPIYDFGEDEDFGPYLVMKFIEGITLSQYLRLRVAEGNLPTAQEVRQLLKPVADALDYSHKNGIVHRDIKSDNIMVSTACEDPQLVDFGLADEIRDSMLRSTGDSEERSGTRAYMAPEMWSGQRGTEKSDQYSLGVVAYELLSGRLPFHAPDVSMMRLCVTNDPVAALPVPESVNAFLSKILSKSPDDRYRSCREAIDALGLARSLTKHQRPTGKVFPVYLITGLVVLGMLASAAARRMLVRENQVHLNARTSNDAETQNAEARPIKPQQFANSLGMQLVFVPPGEFVMGSPPDELGHSGDERQQIIEIPKAFYIGAFEVTQSQYRAVMHENPSFFAETGGGASNVADVATDDFPVEGITWLDANAFCKRLSNMPQERVSGRIYRLPLEHEWEYACRSGTKTSHAVQKLDASTANFADSIGRTTAVGSFPANAFRIHDCHGNVWEWCQNWYTEEYDPTKSLQSAEQMKAFRGGDWKYRSTYCRSAYRERFAHDAVPHQFTVGIRIVCEID